MPSTMLAHAQTVCGERQAPCADVMVIGGGLSGLAACYQLEKLGLPYTVIELRRRFGGQIHSHTKARFIMDASAFAFTSLADEAWLAELGLSEQIVEIAPEAFIFHRGSEALTLALADRLQGGRLMRMAVSSIGPLGSRFTVCLENGMMYDRTAPSSWHCRPASPPALYTIWRPQPASSCLSFSARTCGRWRWAFIKARFPPRCLGRVSLTCMRLTCPGAYPIAIISSSSWAMSARPAAQPADIISEALERLGISAQPLAAMAHCQERIASQDLAEKMPQLRALIPTGISLAGSDYLLHAPRQPGLAQLAERLQAGREAAIQAAKILRTRRRR